MNRNTKCRKTNKKVVLTTVTGALVASSLALTSVTAYASNSGLSSFASGITSVASQMGMNFGGMGNMQNSSSNVTLADSPSEIVESTVENTAASLEADLENATTITMDETNNDIKISESGTYIITGTCSDGNITVKKGTTGVVLILQDLDLTSTTGATLSINKGAEVKLIIEGEVTLTDAEDPTDEDSEDTEVADAFDGAAIKAKDGSNVYLTGSGTLNIDASSCKNGIKVGDADYPSFVIDGSLTININAANDAINAGYDLTILSGTLNISAGDDAIHADRILTIGSSDGTGPTITVTTCEEGFEGTVVNLFGGTGSIVANDDGINAANSDGTYSEEMEFSINITGGTWTVQSGGDGVDSNGNINITGGTITISSASTGGENGIDFDGECYISDDAVVNNQSGISGPDVQPGQNTGMPGQSSTMPGQNSSMTPPGTSSDTSVTTETNTSTSSETSSSATTSETATATSTTDEGATEFGWGSDTYSQYWYEDGTRQGTYSDSKCVIYDGTVRGREIYDPDSDAWYWLDANADGAKATGKEVFMPYVYQDEDDWDAVEIEANALASDEGLSDYIQECITNGTGKWVRYDGNGQMLKGWVTITGELAEIYPDQEGNTYYYDTKTGAMVKGEVTIDGTTYYFDETTGVLVE